ncbi:hypothetical protein DFH11DRAFT_23276 [Phellopilus nigrolimitatus]|nr:hypothetical protein DFH11DRAFT_23276 [Phellopilus nigrolimitatus]
MTDFNDNSRTSSPSGHEDVLHACIAYCHPEMLALDSLIALHARSALRVDATIPRATSLLSVPQEILLRIRAQLQSALAASVAAESAAALREYEAALVEGLCPDCYWWNSDVYGEDVWDWVENGYRGACSCCVVDDVDPRVPSPAKRRVAAKYAGLDLASRAQWLRAHLSRTYLQGRSPWRFARGVLTELGCGHAFSAVQTPDPRDRLLGPVFSQLKKYEKRTSPCDFGSLVEISQSRERALAEAPAITLGRLVRELDIKSFADSEPSIVLESSSSRFIEQVYNRSACESHFRAQRVPAVNCMDCLRAVFASPSTSIKSLAAFAGAQAQSGQTSRLSRFSNAIRTHSAVSTGLLCATGAVYLLARVAL